MREVLLEHDGQAQFTELVSELSSAHGDVLVAAEWKAGAGVVTVRPGATEDVRSVVETYPTQVSVVELDRPTVSQQEDLVSRASDMVTALTSAQVVVGYDLARNTVIVEIGSQSTGDAVRSKDIPRTVALPDGPRCDIEVKYTASP